MKLIQYPLCQNRDSQAIGHFLTFSILTLASSSVKRKAIQIKKNNRDAWLPRLPAPMGEKATRETPATWRRWLREQHRRLRRTRHPESCTVLRDASTGAKVSSAAEASFLKRSTAGRQRDVREEARAVRSSEDELFLALVIPFYLAPNYWPLDSLVRQPILQAVCQPTARDSRRPDF